MFNHNAGGLELVKHFWWEKNFEYQDTISSTSESFKVQRYWGMSVLKYYPINLAEFLVLVYYHTMAVVGFLLTFVLQYSIRLLFKMLRRFKRNYVR